MPIAVGCWDFLAAFHSSKVHSSLEASNTAVESAKPLSITHRKRIALVEEMNEIAVQFKPPNFLFRLDLYKIHCKSSEPSASLALSMMRSFSMLIPLKT